MYSEKDKKESLQFYPDKSTAGWWNLSTCWDHLYQIGLSRHLQKDNFHSTRSWNNKSHIIGVLGEFTVSLESGIEFDAELRIEGDGGSDFKLSNNKTADIKCATFFKDPDLKHPADSTKWPDYFILVALDFDNKKSRLMGWTTGNKLKSSLVKDYGYGPQKIMNWRELYNGLPKAFSNI